jgi:hypothetical protein
MKLILTMKADKSLTSFPWMTFASPVKSRLLSFLYTTIFGYETGQSQLFHHFLIDKRSQRQSDSMTNGTGKRRPKFRQSELGLHFHIHLAQQTGTFQNREDLFSTTKATKTD